MVVYNGERECDNDNSVINIYPSINYYSKLMIISTSRGWTVWIYANIVLVITSLSNITYWSVLLVIHVQKYEWADICKLSEFTSGYKTYQKDRRQSVWQLGYIHHLKSYYADMAWYIIVINAHWYDQLCFHPRKTC